MANLSLHGLDDLAHERLDERAAREGVSMDEEARRIQTSLVKA